MNALIEITTSVRFFLSTCEKEFINFQETCGHRPPSVHIFLEIIHTIVQGLFDDFSNQNYTVFFYTYTMQIVEQIMAPLSTGNRLWCRTVSS